MVLSGELHEIKRNYPRNKLEVRSVESERILAELGECCARMPDGGLLVTLDSPEDKSAMMKRLSESYDIDGIKVFEPSLNDIFVEYAGSRE